jgi:pyridoxine 4-dehydrogenase
VERGARPANEEWGTMSSIITIGGDLVVGRIGFGAMQLTGKQVWGASTPTVTARSPCCAPSSTPESTSSTPRTSTVRTPNELLIREALYPYPDGLVIATKGGFVRGGYDYSTPGAVGNPNYLRQSANLSARRLGVDQLGLYYLHSGRATDAPFEEQVATLAALRHEELIRHIGLSNVTLDQLRTASPLWTSQLSRRTTTSRFAPAPTC